MDNKRLNEIKEAISEGVIFAKMSGKEPDLEEICKSFSSDLSARFPNGKWVTMNGSKVFINNGKAVFGAPEIIKLVNEDGGGQKVDKPENIEKELNKFEKCFEEIDMHATLEAVRDSEELTSFRKEMGISEIEAVVMLSYTSDAYEKVNMQLNSGKVQKVVREFSQILDNTLDKLPNYEGIVHRGVVIKGESAKKYFREVFNTPDGSEIKFPSYLSTSESKVTSDKFSGEGTKVTMSIKSKTGKSVSNMSWFGGEEEVLFKRDSKFKIVSKEYKGFSNIHLTLEEV